MPKRRRPSSHHSRPVGGFDLQPNHPQEKAEIRRKLDEALVTASKVAKLQDLVEELRLEAEKVWGGGRGGGHNPHRHLARETHPANNPKAAQYEKIKEAYEKKVDELNDMKTQMKMADEQTESQITRLVELEQASKKSKALEDQIDKYKAEVAKLQAQVDEERKRGDIANHKLIKAQADVDELELDKEVLLGGMWGGGQGGSSAPGDSHDKCSG